MRGHFESDSLAALMVAAFLCVFPRLALAQPISRQGRDKIGDDSYLFNTCTRYGVLLARCRNVAEAPISSRMDRYSSVQRPA